MSKEEFISGKQEKAFQNSLKEELKEEINEKTEDKLFRELYETKKRLLNEYLVIKKIRDALSYSAIISDIEKQWENRIKKLQDDLELMEVDLKELK